MQATEHGKDAEAGVKLEPLYCIADHRVRPRCWRQSAWSSGKSPIQVWLPLPVGAPTQRIQFERMENVRLER